MPEAGADLKNKIDSLLDQRARYLADEEAKRLAEGASDSFDREVLEAIHEQGRAKGILYE